MTHIDKDSGAQIHIPSALEWEGYFYSTNRKTWVYFGTVEGESRAAAMIEARRELREMGAAGVPVAVVAVPELHIYF